MARHRKGRWQRLRDLMNHQETASPRPRTDPPRHRAEAHEAIGR